MKKRTKAVEPARPAVDTLGGGEVDVTASVQAAAEARIPVVLAEDIALGAGTRSKGTRLGFVVCEPGIEPGELFQALRNPRLCGLTY